MLPFLILFSALGFAFFLDDDEDDQSTSNGEDAEQRLANEDRTNGVQLDEAVSFYRTGPEDSEDGFNIDLVFKGNWQADEQEGIIDAANLLSDAILADVPDQATATGSVDDMRLAVYKGAVDGEGDVLAYAQVLKVRDDSLLPYHGMLWFDRDDIDGLQNIGAWENTALHEMVHTLGFGAVWDEQGLTENSGAAGLRFTGENATAAYKQDFDAADQDAYADSGVPLEGGGYGEEPGGHWDEDVFGAEFMTPLLDGADYVSDMTFASLEDMGYDTYIDDRTSQTDQVAARPDFSGVQAV